jgi:hypothetical protein
MSLSWLIALNVLCHRAMNQCPFQFPQRPHLHLTRGGLENDDHQALTSPVFDRFMAATSRCG